MRLLYEIISQTVDSIMAHKLRSSLTMFGISWGIASVVFMVSIGDGFKQGYRDQLRILGTDVVIFWGGTVTSQVGDQRAGRDVHLTYDDVLAIRQECFLVKHATPELERELKVASSSNSGAFAVHGVAPVYLQIRSMVIEQGRPMNDDDFEEARKVCLIGHQVKNQLFPGRRAVGQEFKINDTPFVVIGEIEHKEESKGYAGLDGDKIFIPYTTMSRYFPDPRSFAGDRYATYIVCMPAETESHEEAVWQVRRTLARRHGFDSRDDGAVLFWDTVNEAHLISGTMDSMQIFLGFIAVVTLGLGGVGVMNIMLVSVAERTREIGLKKAIGATRRRILLEFFLESFTLTTVSGVVGLVGAWAVCSFVNGFQLPAYFGGLPISQSTAIISTATLMVVGILSSIYPARRAAALAPVVALRSE